jgi:hypothetical protein
MCLSRSMCVCACLCGVAEGGLRWRTHLDGEEGRAVRCGPHERAQDHVGSLIAVTARRRRALVRLGASKVSHLRMMPVERGLRAPTLNTLGT